MEITCLAFMLMFFLNSFGKGHVGVEKLFGNKIMGEVVNMGFFGDINGIKFAYAVKKGHCDFSHKDTFISSDDCSWGLVD